MIQTSFLSTPSRRLGVAGYFLILLAMAAGFAFAKPEPALAPAPQPAYQPPSYFFTVDLDPHYQFVGTGALTEQQHEYLSDVLSSATKLLRVVEQLEMEGARRGSD